MLSISSGEIVVIVGADMLTGDGWVAIYEEDGQLMFMVP